MNKKLAQKITHLVIARRVQQHDEAVSVRHPEGITGYPPTNPAFERRVEQIIAGIEDDLKD